MPYRNPPLRFSPNMPPGEFFAQLNSLAEMIGSLYGGISVGDGLQVSQDHTGVRLWVNDIPQLADIKVTSGTSSTITFSNGNTISGYTAEVERWNGYDGSWSDVYTVWFVGANGETPSSGTRYVNCERLGVDGAGVQIWGTSISASSGIAILDKSGSTVDAACVSIKMDTDGVLTVTNLTTGHDQFAVTDASATQRGVVSLTTQTFAGQKLFDNLVTCFSGINVQYASGVTVAAWVTGATASQIIFSNNSFVEIGRLVLDASTSVFTSTFPVTYAKTDLAQGPGTGATTDTTGYFYISTCSGKPTGVPSNISGGYAAVRWDTSGKRFWTYDGVNNSWN